MKVFVTGASGWIGSATVDALIERGHEVVGLVRSDAGAEKVAAKGATVLRGDLDDLGSLRRGAEGAEAVVHLANKHDWSDPVGTNRAERTAVQTMLDVLEGSDRAFVIASGVAGLAAGRPSLESDASPAVGPDAMRGGTENLALDYVDRGVRSISARFAPTTHGTGGDHGFVGVLAKAARRNGTAYYVGDGANAWAAVHVTDAGRLIALGVESAPAGTKLHAVAEEGVPTKVIAEALAGQLGVPAASVSAEEAIERIDPFVGRFFGMDLRSSSVATQQRFGWTPTGPTLLEDIAAGGYPGT